MTGAGRDQLGGEPAELGPLPGGRHGIDPEVLAHNQRERILAAVAQLVAEHGYGDTTIRQIADAASVSRRTLYEQFSGKEDVFLGAYTALDDYLAKLMAEAAGETEAGWDDEVAAALAALIHFLASRPNFARLYLVESVAAGEALVPAREQTSERLMALLAPGRERAAGRPPAEGMEEALVGGILVLLGRNVVAGEGAELAGVIPAVIEFALSPYVGVDAAREVAARHSP